MPGRGLAGEIYVRVYADFGAKHQENWKALQEILYERIKHVRQPQCFQILKKGDVPKSSRNVLRSFLNAILKS